MNAETVYVPVSTSGAVGPAFDFLTPATMWVISQPDPRNWTVESRSEGGAK